MPKPNRLHAPGCIFHITARTQGHHPWFTENLRERVAAEIIAAAHYAGFMLFAFAVMPNHFHILLRQGTRPLAFMMHRVMHRSALLLRYAHNLQGHVFERRYYSGLCSSAEHVRAAIIYTHLNPWRAKLCNDPAEYAWTSHGLYVACGTGERGLEAPIAAREGMRLFSHHSDDDAHRQYLEHFKFQMAVDGLLRGITLNGTVTPPLICNAGNEFWNENFSAALHSVNRQVPGRPIYDVAKTILGRLDPHCPLDLIRSPMRSPKVAGLRRDVVVALRTNGYRVTDIARFMGLSSPTISKITASLRG